MLDELISESAPSQTDDIIHRHAENAYLRYSLAVVKGRALADVEDGQKPVQRRILYAMHRLGLTSSAKPVKSARIIGEVLGKYHPHGDQAAYDAMVRQGQTFTLRYPLIDGQGNYGTLDGDTAAAMRYTEARLSPIAELMLSELDKGTVDFVPNYDGQEQEPSLLPARLPFILLNGTSGIAVGMAAEIPSHNLREVADAACLMVQNHEAQLDDVLQHVKGPDFPGGGQLVSTPAQIREAYRSGRGSLRSRARWVREDLARGQWQIVLTEMPFRVSTRKILEELDTLTNPQPPSGKKALTQEQENLKKLALEFLEKAVDESDKDSPIRLVLVPRTSKVDPEQMMAFLLANTSLEDSVPFNFTVIGLDEKPQTKGLVTILREWADFRVVTVRRRTIYELDVAQKRIHILEGRHVVFLNLDAVIRVIREAEDPKADLMAKFALSEIQATDILEMRLRQLNKLEGFKLERELKELREEAARLQGLLDSDSALRELVVTEIRAAAVKHGDDRRTLIEVPAPVAAPVLNVPDEDITVVISKNLWIKAYRGHGLAADAFSFKTGDDLLAAAETRTVGAVYILDTKGRCYQINGAQVPVGRGDGAPLSTLVDLQDGARIAAVLQGTDETLFLFGGAQGKGFVSPLKNLATRQRAGKVFLKLGEGELPFKPVQLPPREGNKIPGFVVCGSTGGRMLAFDPTEINEYVGGVQGVGLMILEDGESLASAQHTTGAPFACKLSVGGKVLSAKLAGEDWEKHVGHRARKGAFLPKKGILEG